MSVESQPNPPHLNGQKTELSNRGQVFVGAQNENLGSASFSIYPKKLTSTSSPLFEQLVLTCILDTSRQDVAKLFEPPPASREPLRGPVGAGL